MQVQETKINKLVHIFKTLSLMNSMVKCGDTHSIVSKKMYDDAIANCTELQEIIEFFLCELKGCRIPEDDASLLSDLEQKINNFIGRNNV